MTEQRYGHSSSRRHTVRWWCVLVPLCLASAMWCWASDQQPQRREVGVPYYTNYEPKTDNPLIAYQNWAVTQDRFGMVYVGNTSGVLEYDGVQWQLLTLPGRSAVRSLACDEHNRIWVGAQATFGYLEADPYGHSRYVDLRDLIPEQDRSFTDVWRTHIAAEGVYFQTDSHLFRYSAQGKLDVWRPTTAFHLSHLVGQHLYLRQEGLGLMRLVDEQLELVPGGERFADERVYVMLELDDGKILIGTRTQGLFLLDGNDIQHFPTQVDDYLITSQLYHGVVLADHTIALATLRGGAVLLNQQGQLIQILDRTLGLQSSSVTHVFADASGGLWLALDHNLSRVEYPAAFSVFDDKTGVVGAVQSIIRQHSRLLVATTRGVFALTQPVSTTSHPGTVPFFVPIEDIATQCWQLLEVNDQVLAATNDGVYVVIGTRARQITRQGARSLLSSAHNTNVVFVGLLDGLGILRWTGSTWQEGRLIEGIKDQVLTMAEQDDGTLWLGVRYQGVLRLTPRTASGLDFSVARYDQRRGLPNGYGRARVHRVAGTVYIATDQGILTYDSTHDRLQLASSLTFALDVPTTAVTELREDAAHNLWIVSGAGFGVARTNGDDYQLQDAQFRKLQSRRVWDIYPEDDGIVWFGTSNGVIRYDPSVQQARPSEFHCLLRAVYTRSNQRLIPLPLDASSGPLRLPWSTGELRFSYAAPAPGAEAALEYQYQLDGLEPSYSEWSREVKKEYTRLPPGSYTFQVRARTPSGQRSTTVRYSFKITPPWFRSWWAYLCYLIGGAGTLVGFVRFSIARATRKERAEAEHRRRLAELQQARRIQRTMLPSQPPKLAYAEVAAFQRTATEVGGDYYDFFPQDDGTIFVAIGDATGHGLGAGLMVAATKTALLTVSPKDPICEVASRVNYVLRRVNLGKRLNMALTLVGLYPDRRSNRIRLVAAGGGMAPMFVLHRSGIAEEHIVSGIPLGALPEPRYDTVELTLETNDILLLMSDGVAERQRPNQRLMGYLGVQQMLSAIGQQYRVDTESMSSQAFLDRIVAASDAWAGNEQLIDDITLVALKIRLG